MRFRAQCVVFVVMFCQAALPSAPAQQLHSSSTNTHHATRDAGPRPRAQEQEEQEKEDPRPLTLDEGLAIISAALDSRHHKAFSSDCSHFVHGLYQRAGFPYAYAPSADLYAGVEEFRRVTHPQPGDLAVWPGHSGIVVNPAQHSFFSLLRSGPGVDSYTSAYWKKKGHPRFFRYVKTSPGVLSSSNQIASLTPTALEDVGPHETSSDNSESEISQERSIDSKFSTARETSQPSNPITLAVATVNSIHPKPDQVTAAFLQSCADSESALRGHNLSKSVQPVVVFDHFAVRKVHTAGNQNWAEVEIGEVGSLDSGNADTQKRYEKQRWPLIRRGHASWELTIPRNTIYLPQATAVRLLAQQLAQFTQDKSATPITSRHNAELARLLDVLLQR